MFSELTFTYQMYLVYVTMKTCIINFINVFSDVLGPDEKEDNLFHI